MKGYKLIMNYIRLIGASLSAGALFWSITGTWRGFVLGVSAIVLITICGIVWAEILDL